MRVPKNKAWWENQDLFVSVIIAGIAFLNDCPSDLVGWKDSGVTPDFLPWNPPLRRPPALKLFKDTSPTLLTDWRRGWTLFMVSNFQTTPTSNQSKDFLFYIQSVNLYRVWEYIREWMNEWECTILMLFYFYCAMNFSWHDKLLRFLRKVIA